MAVSTPKGGRLRKTKCIHSEGDIPVSNAATSSPRWDPAFIADVIKAYDVRGLVAVSYTHLTLPTIYSV